VFQFRTIEIGRIGCDLAFLLIGHPVDFGLRRFGVNEAINTQTALQADHWKPFHCVPFRSAWVRNWPASLRNTVAARIRQARSFAPARRSRDGTVTIR
jgi:hypothetical protein